MFEAKVGDNAPNNTNINKKDAITTKKDNLFNLLSL